METLRESTEDSSPPKKRKETELKELLLSIKKELADNKAAREELAAQRAHERKEDHEESAQARQEASEHMLKLVGAVTNSILAIIQAQKSN
ncbi:hypothetical protein PF004_g32911 [Phytophthora fragariae]|uniref:Uncharacterized protein n=1 Tax=Phytophthora fragariae TaxID=53985 RepID=A0A6G0M4V1_9STRA|nr:hypothetical protein PF004_g32911 [Phytophthora fragariae]